MRFGALSGAMAAGLLLAGCQTPYQDMGFTGGVTATRITDDEVIISARGNAYTSADTIAQYTLRKAAETTVQDGFDYFRVEAEADRSREIGYSTASVTGNGYGATGFGYSGVMHKPGDSIKIRMFRGQKPANADAQTYDAHELLKYLAPPPASSSKQP